MRSSYRWLLLGFTFLIAFAVSFRFQGNTTHADFLGPVPSKILPPLNLTDIPSFHSDNNTVWNKLDWEPAVGAVAYNVYFINSKIAGPITQTSYDFDTTKYSGETYKVTAIDASGQESIPTAPTETKVTFSADYLKASGSSLGWVTNTPACTTAYGQLHTIDFALYALPEWNAGTARTELRWHGGADASTYNVYRDGSLVEQGLGSPDYIDDHIKPGSVHTYTISCENNRWPGFVEGPISKPLSVTALSSQPTLSSTVTITKTVPNDDSYKVFFNTVPGAADYRIYDIQHPYTVKYAGMFGNGVTFNDNNVRNYGPGSAPTNISIEMNGISVGDQLVVQAVDKPGPFQVLDGPTNNDTPWPGANMGSSVNGQGDPTNIPNVLAQSDPVTVTFSPIVLKGSQVFFDTFRNEEPLQTVPFTSIPLSIMQSEYGCPADATYATCGNNLVYDNITRVKNDKWTITDYLGDLNIDTNFFMSNHLMDTVSDGGYHNNNASNVIQPNATADISGGKILHVTEEVDAHMMGRRWTDIQVGPADEPLLQPAPTKSGTKYPTASGSLFTWQSTQVTTIELTHPDPANPGKAVQTDLINNPPNDGQAPGNNIRRVDDAGGPTLANGSSQNLDNRSKFDLYLSKTHYEAIETTWDGRIIMDHQEDFPAGLTLPFDKAQVYFVHHIYHTGNETDETIQGNPEEQYIYNYRIKVDERHWDNMGFEVVDAFPAPNAATPTPSPTISVTPKPTQPINAVCITLPGSILTTSNLKVTDSAGSTALTALGLVVNASSRITITDSAKLASLSDLTTYTETVTPAGYLAQTMPNITHVLSTCSTLPYPLVGDFNGDGIISISDLVTMFRAFNEASPLSTDLTSQIVFAVFGGKPSLGNIVTVIHNLNQQPKIP